MSRSESNWVTGWLATQLPQAEPTTKARLVTALDRLVAAVRLGDTPQTLIELEAAERLLEEVED